MISNISPDLLHWLAILRMPSLGAQSIQRGLKSFNSIKNLFEASTKALRTHGFNEKQIFQLRHPNFKEAEKDLKWCDAHHCKIIVIEDDLYPLMLREVYAAPPVLFVQGDEKLLNTPQIAMVGSRHASTMGKETALHFSEKLSEKGLTITSGFALGIDAACHMGALNGRGKTIAVFGTGLNCIYPAVHSKLVERIREEGALVSEFLPFEPPKAKNFPQRNRIISGLSLGTFVIEAALKSGSLITARFALEQGREVFAMPGSIHHSLSKGCHQLLREGAKLVETIEDIWEELYSLSFHWENKKVEKDKKTLEIDVESMNLLQHIGYEVTPLDVIIQRFGLTSSEVSSMLLDLELKGLVQNVIGGYIRSGKWD